MRVRLQRNKDKYLRRGYPWVFRNQIKSVEGDPQTGDVVSLEDSGGQYLGQGLFHTAAQIAVRFVTNDPSAIVDAALFAGRARAAAQARARWFGDATHARLVFGESDGLPGTVVDRYGGVITWSCLSAGVERHRDAILEELIGVTGASTVVERNDNPLREKDGLEQAVGVIRGALPGPVRIEESGVAYQVDVLNGPKTGFFIDQRFHRLLLRRFVCDRSVLDVFSADGGFGLQAAHAGAAEVCCVDSSAIAIARALGNAQLNGLTERVSFVQADALEELSRLASDGRRYDVVVLDPPAFAKRRRDVEGAERAYQSININALRVLGVGGLLATSSCSQAFDEEAFLKVIRYAAKRTGYQLRLLFRGCQPPDHPVLDSMPETSYLKFFLFQVVDDYVPTPDRQAR